jgi:hypothetical protein
MNHINFHKRNKELILSKNLEFNNNILSKNKLNCFLEQKQDINKQLNNNETNLVNIKNLCLKKELINDNNNSDNYSSTLEIIEYPSLEKQKNTSLKDDKCNKKDLKYYKMPIGVNGDSDDDIHLTEEDFEKYKNKNEFLVKNGNSQNTKKNSMLSNDDLFFDCEKKKKIVFILKNTKKYHQDLKIKINNFKKLFYPAKEKDDEIRAISNKKSKKENNLKFNTSQKQKKINKESEIDFHKITNQKTSFLIPNKTEYLPKQKKIKNNVYNSAKERSQFHTKANDNNFNSITVSNDSTIKSLDKIPDLHNNNIHKIHQMKNAKKIKNYLTKESRGNSKNLIKKYDKTSLIHINNINVEKNRPHHTKNNNNIFEMPTNRSNSNEKLKNIYSLQKINIDKNKNSFILYHQNNTSKNDNKIYNININLMNSYYIIHPGNILGEKEAKNNSIKRKNNNSKKNKINNQKIVYNLNYIFPTTIQKSVKKVEKFKKDINYSNKKFENNNPFKKNLSKKYIKFINKELYLKKGNNTVDIIDFSNKKIKNNKSIHTPTKNGINYSLRSIKE